MRPLNAILAASVVLLATPAIAQQAPAAGSSTFQLNRPAQPAPVPQPANPPAPKPLFTIFGIPFFVSTPVAAPYCNCAGQTYAGQPVGGRNGAVRADQSGQQ